MDSRRRLATEQKKIQHGATVMDHPEVPMHGMKKADPHGERPNRAIGPVPGPGRPQSEMSRKQKEGYSQHTFTPSTRVTNPVTIANNRSCRRSQHYLSHTVCSLST